ncbi:hypothetical protein B6U96_13905 [Archaeoglobales archaeon ex4484_92]|nr:MAG: hypothetical protein B6U96_13905 [Archaeoglobales archaeon ex4484_92]
MTNLAYLAEWGLKAKDYCGRYLAYVYVNGTDFYALLMKNGLARVYVEENSRRRNTTYASRKWQGK